MSGNYTITANFSALASYTLTMAVAGNGTTTPAVGASTHYEGTVVNLTATPDTGWEFVNWTGDVGTVADVSDPTTTVTMNGDYTITANFAVVPTFVLTMAVDDVAHGSTTPAVGTHTYNQGTVVTITATPLTGWAFDSWTGAVANPNSATTTVTVDADKTVTANFVEAVAKPQPSVGSQWVYNVHYDSTGSGAPSPFTDDAVATLTVTSVAPAGTVVWTGGNDGQGNPIPYTLPDDCYVIEYSFSSNLHRFQTVDLQFDDTTQWLSTELIWERAKELHNTTMGGTTTTIRHVYTGTPGWNLSVGKSWTDESRSVTLMSGNPVNTTYTTYSVTVAAPEQITVPAGVYTCYKVEYRVGDVLKQTDWWDSVVGLVKSINYQFGGPETWELVSYTP
jgi:hypothetical protein